MDPRAITAGRNPPKEINVIIEIPLGGAPVKYELDKVSGALSVDRFLHTAMFYPGNYGFIPQTLSLDGDPCDVLVISQVPVVPGAVIRCRAIGVLQMRDEAGDDSKLLAVPIDKVLPIYKHWREATDMQPELLAQIQHFFEHYKDLEPGKWVKVAGWGDAAEARQLITDAIERERQKTGR